MQTATQEAVGSDQMISSTIGKIPRSPPDLRGDRETGRATQEISGNIQRTRRHLAVAGTIAEVSHGANQRRCVEQLRRRKQLSDSTTSLQAEIDGFLESTLRRGVNGLNSL